MDKESIEKKIRVLLSHSKEGLEIESPKIDFKLKWYDLTSKPNISEFIKDTTAIANTVGTDGFIIIGFDDKAKNYEDATFKDCRLKDSSDIPNLIIKNCSNLFDLTTYDLIIDNHKISVIHIPPTLEKPIVILNHKTYKKGNPNPNQEPHRIFVRKNTRTYPATKNDLELIYYDRKNIQPEYQYIIDIMEVKRIRSHKKEKLSSINIQFSMENLGKRFIAIKKAVLVIENTSSKEHLELHEKEIIVDFEVVNYTKKIKCSIEKNKVVEVEMNFVEDFKGDIDSLRGYDKMKMIFTLSNNRNFIEYINKEKYKIKQTYI